MTGSTRSPLDVDDDEGWTTPSENANATLSLEDEAYVTTFGPLTLTDEVAHVSEVVRQRGETYGHPSEDFRRVSRMEQVLMECPDPEMRHVLFMIAVKMSRLIETPEHRDSWIDIAGYVTTAAMVIDKRGEG